MKRLVSYLAAIGLLVAGVVTVSGRPAAAATLKVTKTADTNDGSCNSDCSLREAIAAANGDVDNDIIRVPAGTYLIASSAEGDFDIESELTIKAIGGVAVINGAGYDRVIEVSTSGDATLTGLKIIGGRTTGLGGGILNAGFVYVTGSSVISNVADTGGGISNSGTLTVKNSTIDDNVALFGAGINNEDGRAEIENSTVKRNRAEYSGGGLYSVGGEAHFRNSTISANTSYGSGAGIHQISEEVVTITSSTINANSADLDNDGGDGGGVFVGGGVNPGGVLITNSLLFGNADGGTTQHPNCSGPLDSLGYNIVLVNAGCEIALESTDTNGAANLEPLAFYGGPTETYALADNSIAIGHGPTGSVACKGTDQRGVPRKGPCDTGAYQLEFCAWAVINVVGTGAVDHLVGTAGDDGILARGGADRVEAGSGSDHVCGGGGNDRLFGGGGVDVLNGAKGDDLLDGGSGNDSCLGGPGRNRYLSC